MQSILKNIFMDKQLIKSVIVEKQQQISQVELLQRSEVFDAKSSYVLIGIRRAGKSYTLYQDILSKLSTGEGKVEDFILQFDL